MSIYGAWCFPSAPRGSTVDLPFPPICAGTLKHFRGIAEHRQKQCLGFPAAQTLLLRRAERERSDSAGGRPLLSASLEPCQHLSRAPVLLAHRTLHHARSPVRASTVPVSFASDVHGSLTRLSLIARIPGCRV